MKRCPHCPATIDRHLLMCAMHWHMVPAELRGLVYDRWDGYRRELARRPRDQARLLTAARGLQRVQQEAIDFVNDTLTRRPA